jgi:hypothetical protein
LPVQEHGGIDKNAKQVGEFTARPTYKYTIRQRSYKFRKKPVKIEIQKEIDGEFADKVIALIAESKVEFESDQARDEFEKLKNATPVQLSLLGRGKGYYLVMNKSDGKIPPNLDFRYEEDKLVIIRVSYPVP